MGDVINITNKATNTEIISEENITLEKLESIFQQAFYKTNINGRFIIVQGHYKIYIVVESKVRLLRYTVYFNRPEKCNDLQKVLHSINNKISFTKFCGDNSGNIYTEYFLDYTGGITPMRIINSMRRFDSFTRTMMVELYKIIDKQVDVKPKPPLNIPDF